MYMFELAPILFVSGLLILLCLYIYTVVHFHRNRNFNLSQRRLWINFLYFFPILSCLIYIFFRNNRSVTRWLPQ